VAYLNLIALAYKSCAWLSWFAPLSFRFNNNFSFPQLRNTRNTHNFRYSIEDVISF
jgi:hypothetical protein